jgi:hypothetical protein
VNGRGPGRASHPSASKLWITSQATRRRKPGHRADHQSAAAWLGYGAAAGLVDAGAILVALPSLPRLGKAFLPFIIGTLATDAVLANRPGWATLTG